MNYLPQIFTYWIITFLVWVVLTPYFIDFLVKMKLWKNLRKEATIWKAVRFFELHKKKAWTPTMWWAMILGTVFAMVLVSIILQYLWFTNNSLLNQRETYLSLFTLWTVWALWMIDDYMNIKWIWRTKGLSARFKMFWLLIFSLLWACWFYFKLGWNEIDALWNFVKSLNIPLFWNIELWWIFIPLFIFIIVWTSNSVNVTDWLDWLAWGLLLFSYWVYAFITFDQWLYLLCTLCVVIIWALVSFLWYNVKPAKFYMWDVWSLALWANLWIMAMLTNTVFVLVIVWSIFILETLSVMIQLISKKFRNWKKVFLIAPFHHHLEAKWWPEETVVFRLWIIWAIMSTAWIITYLIQR